MAFYTVALLLLMMMSTLSLTTAWTAPPPKSGTHAYVKPCGSADYLTSTGVRCATKAMYPTSDGKADPQNRVRCHEQKVGSCKPWYWCEQYARPMDLMMILDSSGSIGGLWKNMLQVVLALIEGIRDSVYPNVQCDENYRSSGGVCKFRMGMQIWGFSNNNNGLCGTQKCSRSGNSWVCTPDKKALSSMVCKVTAAKRTLPCYYPDATIPKENKVSGYTSPASADNGKTFDTNLPNNYLPHMNTPQSPNRAASVFSGWADSRDKAEWAKESGATNQVEYLRWVAQDWHDNWNRCFPRTQWTKAMMDCLYTVRKDNPNANQEDNALRMCMIVTDGAPWRDGFPDGYASPRESNLKWAVSISIPHLLPHLLPPLQPHTDTDNIFLRSFYPFFQILILFFLRTCNLKLMV
jgi:hypothetical protein